MTFTTKNNEDNTRTSNEQYDLIGILARALENIAIYDSYIENVRHTEDRELITFIQELKSKNQYAVRKAKRLLKKRLS